MPSLLFVYGTLIPGQAPTCVADLVARFRVVGRATVRGELYDTGRYPALVLNSNAGPTHGWLCEVPDDEVLWRRLDNYEGFDPDAPDGSLFRRVPATAALADGTVVNAQTYVYNRPTARHQRIAGGDWLGRASPSAETAKDPSMKRPVIGITCSSSDANPSRYEAPADYARSVERAGGLPILLPFRVDLAIVPDLLDLVDGMIFSGGNDLDPALYGESRHANAVPLDPQRQSFELALIAEAERRRTPTLGICLGSQVMNVHRGGSLHQYLPDVPRDAAIEHRHLGDNGYRHPVTILDQTLLADVVGASRVSVNSRHKQAVKQLGRGLRVSATADDGVIEAFEDPAMPLFLAVQWHPENLTADSPEQLKLFERLVEVARQSRVHG